MQPLWSNLIKHLFNNWNGRSKFHFRNLVLVVSGDHISKTQSNGISKVVARLNFELSLLGRPSVAAWTFHFHRLYRQCSLFGFPIVVVQMSNCRCSYFQRVRFVFPCSCLSIVWLNQLIWNTLVMTVVRFSVRRGALNFLGAVLTPELVALEKA